MGIAAVVSKGMIFGDHRDTSMKYLSVPTRFFLSSTTGSDLPSAKLRKIGRESSEERCRRKPASACFPSSFFCFVNATLGHYSTLKRERVVLGVPLHVVQRSAAGSGKEEEARARVKPWSQNLLPHVTRHGEGERERWREGRENRKCSVTSGTRVERR